ncbi:MAG: DUF2934 domain-containing protein [Methylobacter sp.]
MSEVKKMSTPANSTSSSQTISFIPISLPDCYTKIAEIAFYKAEKRGFEPGYEFDDWIEAEQEYKRMITEKIPH